MINNAKDCYFYKNDSIVKKIKNSEFLFIPSELLRMKFNAQSKILYGLILDKINNSIEKNNILDNDKIYVIYPLKEICDNLNIFVATSIKILKMLEEIGAIEIKKTRNFKNNIIYPKNIFQM